MRNLIPNKSLGLLIFLILALGNCEKSQPALEYFPNMHDSPAREAMEDEPFFKDGMAMRQPPAGTVPRGYIPYPFEGSPDTLKGGWTNPLKATRENYESGEKKYQTFCTPCHGVTGEGNGRVVGGYPRFSVPMFNFNLLSPKIKGWSDGQLFHMITVGRGQMPAYAYQIPREDRWKIVMYLRKLQEYNSKVANK